MNDNVCITHADTCEDSQNDAKIKGTGGGGCARMGDRVFAGTVKLSSTDNMHQNQRGGGLSLKKYSQKIWVKRSSDVRL